jgi:uncharacterized protein (TIGR02646 family)
MRRIQRLPLSQDALDFLRQRTSEVEGKPDAERAEEAVRLWKLQGKAFKEVRQVLGQMASGIKRCMYCEDSKGIAVEHFRPKKDYPLQAFVWLNYLLACTECNSNYKRTQFPLDGLGNPLLLDPSDPADDPLDHLAFSPSTGLFEPQTDKGRASCQVYGLDRGDLARARHNTWVLLREVFPQYARHKSAGRPEKAAEIERAIREQPFSGVFAAFLRIARSPGARMLIGDECLQVLRDHPEIEGWL